MECLNITTPTLISTDLHVAGTKTERLINILTKLGATSYLSGPAAAAYLNLEMFKQAGIRLEYKSYAYEPYPQLYGPFDGNVSVLDILFNMGEESRNYLHSKEENILIT
jgi:hypothetical protein